MKGFFPTNPAHLWNSNVGCKLSTCSLFFPFPSPPPLHFSSSNRIISDTLNLQPFNRSNPVTRVVRLSNKREIPGLRIYIFFLHFPRRKEIYTRIKYSRRYPFRLIFKLEASEKLSRKLFTQQKCSKCCSTLKIIPQTKDCPFFVLVKTPPPSLPPLPSLLPNLQQISHPPIFTPTNSSFQQFYQPFEFKPSKFFFFFLISFH